MDLDANYELILSHQKSWLPFLARVASIVNSNLCDEQRCVGIQVYCKRKSIFASKYPMMMLYFICAA